MKQVSQWVVALVCAAGGLLVAAPSWANQALAQKNACMACHAVDKKLVGPAYQEVAKKYLTKNRVIAVLKPETAKK